MAQTQIIDLRPERSFPGAVPYTDIYFQILDNDGININTLTVRINGILAVSNGIFQTGFSGAFTKVNPPGTDYRININPDIDFLYHDEVTVGIKIADNLSNYYNDFYKFTIIDNPDNIPPTTIPIPRGGIFATTQNIQLVTNEVATTYYTLDGTTPSRSSTVYTGLIPLNIEGTFVLKFFSADDGNDNPQYDNIETIKQEIYILDFTAPITTIVPDGGTFYGEVSITFVVNESATTYYTTDGTIPTISSTIYTNPFLINTEGSNTLKFFSVDLAGNSEVVQTQVFTISTNRSSKYPTNVFVTTPYIRGIIDLTWDDMLVYDSSVIGYNVYRSYYLEGPYRRLNNQPILTTSYRDEEVDLDIINENVSIQFQQTVIIENVINDAFVGNTIDITKWNEMDEEEIIAQNDGLYIIDQIGIKVFGELRSIYKLRGDFIINVGLDLLKWNQPSTQIQEIGLRVMKKDDTFISVSRKMWYQNDILESKLTINGTPDIPTVNVNTLTLLGFKIERSGDTIVTYYIDSMGNAIQHEVFTDTFTNDLYVSLYGDVGDVPIEARFYEFQVVGMPIIIKPLLPQKEYVIKTSRRPIVGNDTGPTGTTNHVDFNLYHNTADEYVEVTIDGVKASIKDVLGLEGEIVLKTEKIYDHVNKQWIEPPIPNEHTEVLVTYKTPNHDVDYSLRRPLYYKVTLIDECGESELSLVTAVTLHSDSIDYMYTEAIRRNNWMLEMTGEPVLLFVKAKAGIRCDCYLQNERTHSQPINDCKVCYGTGFTIPYAGPFPILLSPLMTEQKIAQSERGLRLEYQIDTWTITPHIISQRDFMVRRDGTILGVGAQTVPEVRGKRLTQQHFSIQPVDRTDIRYKYLDMLRMGDDYDAYNISLEDLRTTAPIPPAFAYPEVYTKGRTFTFQNINF